MMRRFAALVGTMLVAVLALSGVALASGPFAVTKTVPNGGATGIARAANVSAYFNHDVRGSTVTSTTFKIRKQGTTTWLGATRSVNNTISPTSTNGGSQSVATLNPNADLAAGTTYQVVVVGGSSGVKDVNGRALGANKSWTFTTATTVVATPPETTIGSGPMGTVTSTSATFTFSSSKSGSTFQCSLDNAAFSNCNPDPNTATSKSYSGLSQGPHTFQVRAIDSAGNVDATPATRSWTVDTIGPDASITDGPPDPSNSRSASFSFTGAEAGGSYQCKIDSAASTGTFTACTSGQSFTVDADGTFTFSVRASDALGNFGTPDSHTWTVDTTTGVTITPNPLDLSPTDVLGCARSESLTVTNNGPSDVTFATASKTGTDAAYFSDGGTYRLATQGPFTVEAETHITIQVSFSAGSAAADRLRDYSTTLTYKDATGATIGNAVTLTARARCLNFG